MTKHISKYVVYIEEDDWLDIDAVKTTTALEAIPGYVEHEWLDWTDA